MALGLLLVILGLWLAINGWNGNIPGLFKSPTPTTKIDTSPATTNTPVISPGKP